MSIQGMNIDQSMVCSKISRLYKTKIFWSERKKKKLQWIRN